MTCAVSAFMVVDFPAPLGPSSPTHVPYGTSRSRPSTAVMGERPVPTPYRLTTPRSLIADSLMTRPYHREPRTWAPEAGASALAGGAPAVARGDAQGDRGGDQRDVGAGGAGPPPPAPHHDDERRPGDTVPPARPRPHADRP